LFRSSPLTVLMAAAIAVVVALAYWDARRESESAFADLGRDQATLAQGVAAVVLSHLRDSPKDAPSPPNGALLSDVVRLERANGLRLFVARPDAPGLTSATGPSVRNDDVERALAAGEEWVRVRRAEAPSFGLPERTAVAGLARFDGPSGRWGVVAAATALRERDREVRAEWRLGSTVALAALLVLAFGGLAMRKQRQELILSRELAVSELERQKEEQLGKIDKLATLAALSTGIAHEVSTPLGVIVGRAEQLLPKVADDRAKRSVESIIEQGTRIDRVIRGFLTLARGEAPSLENVSPSTVAIKAVELVEHRFEKAHVALSLRLSDGLPEIAGDARLLEQVIINLLQNAADACEAGGLVELRVETDGDTVAFTVTDDGVGITKESAARATEPFFTTKPIGEGTGLGLAISNEIVKHYGGNLTIEPVQSAKGTRARVTLPVSKGRG